MPGHRVLAGLRAGNAERWRRLGGLERTAVVVWALTVLVITLRIVVRGDGRHGVYPVFENAGRAWLEGTDLYGADSGFRYPPIAAAFFVPFELVGARIGGVLWRWLNFWAYLGAVLWACRIALPTALSRRSRAALFVLLLLPSLTSLNNGQSNALVAGCLIAAAVAVQQGRFRLAAVLATVPVLFKVYPIALGLLFAVLYPRRFLPWFALALAAGLGLPFVLQDPAWVAAQYGALADLLRAEDRTVDVGDAYRDLRLVLLVFGAPISNSLYPVVQLSGGAAIAALGLAGRRAGFTAAKLGGYLVAFSCCWMTLLGPATEKATYILVAPALCWLIVDARQRRARAASWVYALCYALGVVTQGLSHVPRATQAEYPIMRILLPLSVIVIAAALTVRAAHDLSTARGR